MPQGAAAAAYQEAKHQRSIILDKRQAQVEAYERSRSEQIRSHIGTDSGSKDGNGGNWNALHTKMRASLSLSSSSGAAACSSAALPSSWEAQVELEAREMEAKAETEPTWEEKQMAALQEKLKQHSDCVSLCLHTLCPASAELALVFGKPLSAQYQAMLYPFRSPLTDATPSPLTSVTPLPVTLSCPSRSYWTP